MVRMFEIRSRSNNGRQSNITTVFYFEKWHLDGNPDAFFMLFLTFIVPFSNFESKLFLIYFLFSPFWAKILVHFGLFSPDPKKTMPYIAQIAPKIGSGNKKDVKHTYLI